jgi:secreted trypsin-like serine protease
MTNANQTFLLGTAVKLTSLINIATATSAKITIDDPNETEKVSSANMTKDADGVYHYIYQSASTDQEGDYIATISIVYGGYTAVEQFTFTLEEQE